MRHLAASMFVFALFAVACGSDENGSSTTDEGGVTTQDAAYAAPNPSGKLHGEACTTNEECAFLTCYKSPFVSKSEFGFCTKDCTGGAGNMSVCSAENTDSIKFSCLRLPNDAEAMENFCVRVCSSVDECYALGNGYDACSMTDHIAQKYCHVE